MVNVWTIAAHEYRVNVRRLGFVFSTLLYPALGTVSLALIAFFASPAGRSVEAQLASEARPLGVVDQSGLFAPLPAGAAGEFAAFEAEAAARAALLADEIAAYAVIPHDYLETGAVAFYVKENSINASARNSAKVRSFLQRQLLEGKVDPATLKRFYEPAQLSVTTLDAGGKPQTAFDASAVSIGLFTPYLVAFLLSTSIFPAAGYLLNSLSEEKETRVVEMLLSSVTAAELLAGKVIGLGLLGLTQMSVWIVSSLLFSVGVGALIADSDVLFNPWIFGLEVVYFLFGYLLYGILIAVTGMLGADPRERLQIAGVFSLIASTPYILFLFISDATHPILTRVVSYFPLTAPVMMMLRLPLTNVPALDVGVSLGVLAASIPLAFWAGARLFRASLLMYGKRLSLRQMWRALREA